MTDETQGLPPAEAEPVPEVVKDAAPATAPEAPDNAPDDAGEEKHKGGFQRRISELTQRWREAERRSDQLLELIAQQREAAKPVEPELPTLEAVGFDESKYQQSMIEYAKAQARAEAKAEIQSWQQQQRETSKVETFKSREQSFAETTADYADVVYAPDVPISRDMAEVIRESEVGPQLAYHLAQNRDLARAIHDLPPLAAARELGKLEARLAEKPKPAPRVVSQAPPPPPKIEATEPDAVEKDPIRMTDAQFAKWRARQIAQRR